jgi:microcystin-dependent protein
MADDRAGVAARLAVVEATGGAPGPQGIPGADGSPLSVAAAWPIGSVFISVVSTNPGTLLGVGTWAAFGAGRVLVGRDSGDTDFDTAEETGGAKTHTLGVAEMPAHTHAQDAHNHTQNSHTHIVTSQTATTGSATSYEHGVLDTSSADAEATEVTGGTVATNQAATATNQNTGGSGAHNNLQPYIVCYFWKRTA